MNQPILVTTKDDETVELQMSLIFPNPLQPRTIFIEHDIKELSGGIKEHGLKEPIVVRPTKNGTYEIVSGERRYRAHKLIDATTIKAKVQQISDGDLLLESVTYNGGRRSLTPRDAFFTIVKLKEEGRSIQTIATAFSKSTAWVNTYLKLQNLAPELQAILQHEKKEGELLIKNALKLAELKNHKY